MMSDANFSLLSQEEIDILIDFLLDKSNQVESEVLSQESIDKLVNMMRTFGTEFTLESPEHRTVRAVSSVLDQTSTWLLDFDENEVSGFMQIYVTDGRSKEYITPRSFTNRCFVSDESEWGLAVGPIQFVEIAKRFHVKFTKDTYDDVCKRFSEKNFGREAYELDRFFLPEKDDILSCLDEK